MVVAIDGPAASGKSSTAQWVARELQWRHVDSGALYRAVAAALIRSGREPGLSTEGQILDAARIVTLEQEDVSLVPHLAGRPSDAELRSSAVTRTVPEVARIPTVREWVNSQVRRVAGEQDVVVDGRDIGTAVFPDADVKVFLVADPWERARRRLAQRLRHEPTDDEIARETEHLVHRDAADATQSVPARDAVLIDTTYLDQREQVARIVALVGAATQARRRRV